MATAFDPFTASTSDVQAFLSAGKFNSSQLIGIYLDRITKDNEYLKAVIAVAPRAVLERQAERLDKERSSRTLRRPLPGVPILIKLGVPVCRPLQAYMWM
jgi:amidase